MANTAASYHRTAEACRRKAQRAVWDKAQWLRLAEDWEHLAESTGGRLPISTALATLKGTR
jgi:hypothetical protein